MKKRTLTLLLAFAMLIGLLAACGDSTESSASEAGDSEEISSVEESAEPEEEESEEPEEEPAEEEPAEEPAEEEPAEEPAEAPEEPEEEPAEEENLSALEVTLPLTEETETITFWWGGFDGGNFGNDNPGVTAVSQELEARTNVHVEYTSVAGSAAEEMRSLMYASQDYCDIINQPGEYTGGLEKGYEDGVFIDLTDYLEEYSPNYAALIASDPDSERIVATDGGYHIAFYQFFTDPSQQGNGMIIRKDYLDELGLDLPVTYDDWTTALTRMKEELGVATPYYMEDDGLAGGLMSGFGLSTDWYQVDGTVMYAPIQDSFRDYLALMNEWYEAGLFTSDFTNHVPGYDNQSEVLSGDVAAIFDRSSTITDYMTSLAGSEFVGITEPVQNEGDALHFYTGGSMLSEIPGVAISTNCENIELCMRWMDYLYTEEGSILNSYGVEGETYEIQADGSYGYTDLLLDNPDGLPLTLAKLKYLDGLANGTGLYDPACEMVGVNENTLACDATWQNDGAYVLPNYELTTEEGEEFSAVMADVETYVDEMTLRYITGADSLDSFDEYVESVKNMNVDRAIEIEQIGLDRYMSR